MTVVDGVLERERTIAASPEIVFAHFVDPERIVRWMGRTATLDPRPGGVFRIDYNGHDIVSGQYLEVEPPRRVVLTWGWEAPDQAVRAGASRVEVDLEPVDGGTRLRLRHLGLPPGEVESHGEGWDYFLPRLDEAVAS